jgi:hypothetical protein
VGAHFGSFILFGKKSKGTKTFSPLSFFLSFLFCFFTILHFITPLTLSTHYGLNDLDSTLDGDHLHLLSIRKSVHVDQQKGRWDKQGIMGTIAAISALALEWYGIL